VFLKKKHNLVTSKVFPLSSLVNENYVELKATKINFKKLLKSIVQSSGSHAQHRATKLNPARSTDRI
jgi:hypothetical protein